MNRSRVKDVGLGFALALVLVFSVAWSSLDREVLKRIEVDIDRIADSLDRIERNSR